MASQRTPAKRSAGRATHIRAVSAGERANKPAPAAPPAEPEKLKTLDEAIAGGNYREILEAQCRDISAALPKASGPSRAALHMRLSAIAKELEEMKVAGTGAGSVVATSDDDTWDPEAI